MKQFNSQELDISLQLLCSL